MNRPERMVSIGDLRGKWMGRMRGRTLLIAESRVGFGAVLFAPKRRFIVIDEHSYLRSWTEGDVFV